MKIKPGSFVIHTRPILWVIALNVLFSAYLCYQAVLNSDAYLYMYAANDWVHNGWFASYQRVGWPFYPGLLAFIHTLTGLPFDSVIYLVNTYCFVGIAVVLWRILALLGSPRTVQLSALILFFIAPQFNAYRDQGIRDIPYWTCFLFALLQLLAYQDQRRRLQRNVWHGAMLLATLFRFEGVVLWVVLSIYTLNTPQSQLHGFRIGWDSRRSVCLLASLSGLAILLWGLSQQSLHNSYLKHFSVLFSWHFWSHIKAFALPLLHQGQQDIYNFPKVAAYVGSIAVYGAVYLFKLWRSVHPAYVLLALIGCYHPQHFSRLEYRRVLLTAAQVAALVPFAYLLQSNVTSTRFYMPLAFIVLIYSAYGVATIWSWHQQFWPRPVMLVLLLFLCADSLFSLRPSKSYYRQAGEWIIRHSDVSAKSTYYNTREVAFYADRYYRYQGARQSTSLRELLPILYSEGVDGYDRVVLEVTRHEKREKEKTKQFFRQWHQYEFVNQAGDAVCIFDRPRASMN